MIRLDKKLVDEFIRITKWYYKKGDAGYLNAYYEAKEVLEKSASWQVADLIHELAKYTQISGKGTYEDIYKALAIFGVIVE